MEKYYKIRFPTETARCGVHIIIFFAFTQSLTNFTCGIAVELNKKIKTKRGKVKLYSSLRNVCLTFKKKCCFLMYEYSYTNQI